MKKLSLAALLLGFVLLYSACTKDNISPVKAGKYSIHSSTLDEAPPDTSTGGGSEPTKGPPQ